MAIRKINGTQLEKMLFNGFACLQQKEEEINRLNVFPVADGDTGTNMRKTLENGLRIARSTPDAGVYLKSLSDGMLLGARGNSGVILSQFFRGLFLELSHCGTVNPGELRNGLIRGYRTAYQAVVQPTEGTILTVTREGIEHIRSQINRTTTVETLLAMYVAEMKKSLANTPEMLAVLKESGVVDSGAMGFIVIVEGMLKYLYGEEVEPLRPLTGEKEVRATPDALLFNENSSFEDGYCMEFILQLLSGADYNQRFRLNAYIEDLKLYGNSIVAVQDGKRVKIHVHTLRPAKIIAASQEYGEFLTFKLENMQVQHNEHVAELKKTAHRKALATVAVVNGDGMADLFRDLGCDHVIDGGATMNTSSQEFLDVFAGINADAVAVLPNNPNVVLAAQQAAQLQNTVNVTVLPTASPAEGYFALAMDVPDSEDAAYRLGQMKQGIKNVVTLAETTASRDYSYHEISCKKGDCIVLLDHELVCVGSDWVAAVADGLSKVEDMEDRDVCVIFRGKDVPEEDEARLADAVAQRFPLLEPQFLYGGQEIYHWIIGIS